MYFVDREAWVHPTVHGAPYTPMIPEPVSGNEETSTSLHIHACYAPLEAIKELPNPPTGHRGRGKNWLKSTWGLDQVWTIGREGRRTGPTDADQAQGLCCINSAR